jgi:acyl dehydratase
VQAIAAHVSGVAVPHRHLVAYRRLCGFGEDGRLPLTYPHVLAMPLQLAILTSRAFPLRLMGLVHVRNAIRSRRPLGDAERLDLRCRVEGHRETERGQEIDLVTEVEAAGERVWWETSTLLARRRRPPGAPHRPAAEGPGHRPPPAGLRTSRWDVPASIGRRYALVSRDLNPIHLARVTARWLGFERAIAHGMWSLARAVAEIGPPAPPGPASLDAAFKLPVLLPARLLFRAWPDGGGTAFSLLDERGERPHLAGALSPT